MSTDPSMKASPPDRVFRRLSKNDIHQTVEQWRERTLQRLGEVSGRWTAWVEKDNIPTLPSARPRAPVKPSTESLMTPLKLMIRQRLFQELIASEAKTAAGEGKATERKLDDIPMPSDYDAWAEYEDLKSRFLFESREYERKEKTALEVFPDENRKVFSALIDCISEASVHDLKRTADGARAFDTHDAYAFFKLAIQEHEYLPPAISSAAVARARDEFERLQQKSEDTITEHVNEFRRRLEALLKARGPDGGSPYMDFDLRDLLLKSLYKPTWSAWIASREANDNMPVAFESLVLALKKAETTMVLKGSSPLDTHMPSAHLTKSDKSDSPSTTSFPSKCQCCGATFTPKRPAHTRCDACQADYSTKKKREKKKGKETAPKAKTKGKHINKKAHHTVIDDDEEDENDDEEDEFTANFTSFSCTCSTRSTPMATSDDLVYFDNCSNLNIIKDKSLALSIREEPVTTRITGSIPGALSSNRSAELGDLGRGCYDPNFSRNLISEDAVIRAGYRVIRDSASDSHYYLRKEGRPPLVFTANAEGTFSISTTALRQHFSDLYSTCNSTDVRRESMVFTKRQRERAEKYHFDHQHCLAHLHHDRVIKALCTGMIVDAPYTEADVRNSLVIHGPCPVCSRTKGTKHAQTGHYPSVPAYPGERLAGDLFNIMGILFSVITCRLIKLRCVTKLNNKGAMEVTRAIGEAVGIWRGYGSKSRVLSWDQEPAVVSSAAEIWAKHSLRLEFTPPEGHERVAERDVRTIKEHVYSNILSLNHAVDDEMIEGMVRDTVVLLNYMPNSETQTVSPRSILDGERLNYARWSRVYAGQVAEFEIPYAQHTKGGVRRELGYVLGHQGDNPIVRLLPAGKRLVIRSGHINVIEKSPAIINLIEQGITGAKRQRYNDLLSEINEFYSTGDLDVRAPQSVPSDGPTASESYTQEPPQLVQLAPPEATLTYDEPLTVLEPADSPTQAAPPSGNAHEESPGPASVPDMMATPPTLTQPVVDEPPQLRRSNRLGAKKPDGFYSKLSKGESVADYTACHMRAAECERLYGAEPTLEAGLSEVTNMIGRKAAIP